MEDKRILTGKRLFALGLGLALALVLKACFLSYTPSNQMVFRDEQGHPIENVVLVYGYAGTGAFNGYSKPGGIAFSDAKGRLNIPARIFPVRPFDSNASQVSQFLYSNRMHAGGILNDTSLAMATGFYRQAGSLGGPGEVVLADWSDAPTQWFFCLNDLFQMRGALHSDRQAALDALWQSEKRDFLAKFGGLAISGECIREIERFRAFCSNEYLKRKNAGERIVTYRDLIKLYDVYEN